MRFRESLCACGPWRAGRTIPSRHTGRNNIIIEINRPRWPIMSTDSPEFYDEDGNYVPPDEPHFLIVKTAFDRACRTLRRTPFRLWPACPKYLDWTEWRRFDHGAFAEEFDVTPATVLRAMEKLVQEGWIERRGRKPDFEYRLEISWGWRGDFESYEATLKERGRARLS
jgi:hypothetical protein